MAQVEDDTFSIRLNHKRDWIVGEFKKYGAAKEIIRMHSVLKKKRVKRRKKIRN